MSLADIIRGAVATARSITLPLHVTVTFDAWTGQDSQGAATYKTTRPKALAEKRQQTIRNSEGQLVQANAYIAILEELKATSPLAGHQRDNPIDSARDKFTLPDGTTGPIVRVTGFYDGGTGVPYFSEVWLG